MTCAELVKVIKQAEMLTPDEQLQLVAHLKTQQVYRASPQRRRWREICGAAAYPLLAANPQSQIEGAYVLVSSI